MKLGALLIGLMLVIGAMFLPALPQQILFSKDVQPILTKECSNCHGAKKPKGKLDLSEASALKSLISVPSDEVSAMMRVMPGDPEQSYLWLKLDHRAKEGSGMPKRFLSSKKLPQDQLDLIKAWIAGGAKE